MIFEITMRCKIYYKRHNEHGISLLLTVLILSSTLAISLMIAALIMSEVKLSGRVEDSTVAYFAADTGVEGCLYFERKGSGCETGLDPDIEGTLNISDGTVASYEVKFENVGGFISVKSLGSYLDTKRGVEVNWNE